jgi:hypothetical protein
MATEDKDDKTLAEKMEELVVVEGTPEGEVAKTDDKPAADAKDEKDDKDEKADDKAADATDDKHDDDDEDEDETGDARASSEAAADAADEQKKKKDRESSAERRQRQREARERLEKELRFYQSRNEQLERRFSAVETRQQQQERLTLQQAIEQTEAQIKEAKKIEAEAIAEADGASAVEARDIAQALEEKHRRLVAAKTRTERPAPSQDRVPPPAMAAAFDWIKANKDWYDPQGGNEDSVLASAIEDRLSRENKIDPATPEFWAELDRRLKARGIGKKAAVDEKDDDDDNASSHAAPRSGNGKPAGERTDARTKSNGGGPKVSVGGASRALKANEVFVSPERKAAMIEAGVWDDPVLKQKMLRDYQRYDRDAAAAARR